MESDSVSSKYFLTLHISTNKDGCGSRKKTLVWPRQSPPFHVVIATIVFLLWLCFHCCQHCWRSRCGSGNTGNRVGSGNGLYHDGSRGGGSGGDGGSGDGNSEGWSGLANQKTQKPKNPGFFKVFSGFFQKIFEKTRFFQNFSKMFGKYDQSLTKFGKYESTKIRKFGKYDQSLTKKNIIYF